MRDYSEWTSFSIGTDNLQPGTYTLTVSLTDVRTGRMAVRAVHFTVDAP